MNLTLILAAPALQWQAAFKKTKKKPRYFNWYHYVVNGRKKYKGNMSLYLLICNSIKKYFFTLMNNEVLRKTMGHVRKQIY